MSEYNQQSFQGGMNLLVDDTRLHPSQYRLAFNCHNRYDVMDPVYNSVLDTSAPNGIKQGILTFGNYIIMFAGGYAYFRAFYAEGWSFIPGFLMSVDAPRFWTAVIPVATTNYGRFGVPSSAQYSQNASSGSGIINVQSIAGASGGNLPGLLVQDNINQPQFIYISDGGFPVAKTTQTYGAWRASYDVGTGNLLTDQREYVPIGSCMAWVDSVLYIVSQDRDTIHRSVSGRPLDFVINVNTDGSAGGDAHTTDYSVGVGGITVLRSMNDGSLFVGAQNSNFIVEKNRTPGAPTLFGEYTFIRKFLFEATCMSDRSIMDSQGDTKFIDITGVRSFNAIELNQNEGRNSVFSATIAAAFKGITQTMTACVLFDNYELYAMDTIFGPCIVVYDTISEKWSSFDNQTAGKRIKQFAKIEVGTLQLFAITEDDKFYTLYSSAGGFAEAAFMSVGICATDPQTRVNNSKNEIKLTDVRCILNRITQNCTLTIQPFINNRQSVNVPSISKNITYSKPTSTYVGVITDLNTQLTNLYYTFPNLEQGWKVALLISWTGGGSLTQFSTNMTDVSPMNPLLSQVTVK